MLCSCVYNPYLRVATTYCSAFTFRRGHGLTIVAGRVEDVVMRCIYTLNNAKMQTSAILTRSAYLASLSQEEKAQSGGLAFLNSREAKDAGSMNQNTVMRPWKLWCREVEADPLYVNYGWMCSEGGQGLGSSASPILNSTNVAVIPAVLRDPRENVA